MPDSRRQRYVGRIGWLVANEVENEMPSEVANEAEYNVANEVEYEGNYCKHRQFVWRIAADRFVEWPARLAAAG